MAADNAILEALARIEHKVDLCLKMVTMVSNAGGGAPVLDHPAMMDPTHRCPVCGQNPKYNMDILNAIVTRSCGCGTGKIMLDLNALAPPTLQRRTPDDRTSDNTDDSSPRPIRSRGTPSR